ncbi:MAG: type II CRISPR RNA-guided endonuclease Cas9 [Parvibaculum sp.]|uniref:type II CRISPR RNA-guided endonuclease Cas9 n=1 Tax=Parvibaculum sp. TaxID=2024848 RepID=UPI002ABD0E0E|nr:type II CRISPR RNA-guided endonuclease Cas9 [Parvibaculum sp.]MDZ4382999.1 type II CRISPR RNA-guided endonuclease Cas9 [Parvibaculum sp.]
MERIFGFDIGTTSIGFAVVDYSPEQSTGNILRLGARIFPEARDPDGTPLNQQRRQKRMMRRQLRRRRMRRKTLNEALRDAGLLPAYGSPDWPIVMGSDPYDLRRRGLEEELSAHEFGRAIYHLAQHRHFKGRELDESDTSDSDADDEKEAQSERDATLKALRNEQTTLGAWLARRAPSDRKRGVHAHRTVVLEEFERLWTTQSEYHPALQSEELKAKIGDTIFAQRPVFWRKNTLGDCRFMPGAPLCPKGSWLSQQRRMLEKLNNLAIAGGNARPLDDEERDAILSKLQQQASMSWPGVRSALRPLYKQRGEPGAERSLKFNLELGGESKLLGNALEAKLADIFGADWPSHPHKQGIRNAVHERLWAADYGETPDKKRVIILSDKERKAHRKDAAKSFVADFGVVEEQAAQLQALKLPTGWEPYSISALNLFLPELEKGERFGALVNGPDWENWRREVFPNREQPTGEILDKLPSPASKEERERISQLRNPTVVRTQNELRKVVNNLIALYGKPDRIRVEVGRDVGKSKREREEIQSGIRKAERRRSEATKDLQSKGIPSPSRDDVEKWLLWKEGQERCPYTGDQIAFAALFREGQYEVEHIWPRSRSFDDSPRNKTLCRKDVNIEKGNRMPFEAFGHDEDRWSAIQTRLQGMVSAKGGAGMSPGKVKRFLATEMPDDFAARQLNDTRYAAKQILAQLKRLWPDMGPEAPVKVEAVTGKVTAQLRKLWTLNNVLADNGEKTRADHRHHAVDALAVACTHPGMTNKLSRYWQLRDDPRAPKPTLSPPWDAIRADAERAVSEIVVSHRVRKKVSGALHKETTYGDTGDDVKTKSGTYRQFVTRKKVEALSKGELEEIRDPRIREIVTAHVASKGGDPKKAFPPYPRVSPNGPEIRKVRLTTKQQLSLMGQTGNGYADLGSNHHIAIYRLPDGKTDFEIVSLFEASRRLSQRKPVIQRTRADGARFVMSLAAGEAIKFPAGTKKGIWIVQGVWASGQVVLERDTDANHATTTRPMPNPILKDAAIKISIDPIGQVRSASD